MSDGTQMREPLKKTVKRIRKEWYKPLESYSFSSGQNKHDPYFHRRIYRHDFEVRDRAGYRKEYGRDAKTQLELAGLKPCTTIIIARSGDLYLSLQENIRVRVSPK